jgi:hypothetical protein
MHSGANTSEGPVVEPMGEDMLMYLEGDNAASQLAGMHARHKEEARHMTHREARIREQTFHSLNTFHSLSKDLSRGGITVQSTIALVTGEATTRS